MIQYREEMDKPKAETIEGMILIVGSNRVVTLADGVKLTIPKTMPKDQLKPGAMIVAEYEQKGGRKIATSVQIKG